MLKRLDLDPSYCNTKEARDCPLEESGYQQMSYEDLDDLIQQWKETKIQEKHITEQLKNNQEEQEQIIQRITRARERERRATERGALRDQQTSLFASRNQSRFPGDTGDTLSFSQG